MVRVKSRYFVVHVTTASGKLAAVSEKAIYSALQQSATRAHGENGASMTAGVALQVRCFDRHSGICIIRSDRATHQDIWTALTLVTKIGAEPAACRVLRIAGSVRTLKPTVFKLNKERLRRILALSESELEAAEGAFARSFSAAFEG